MRRLILFIVLSSVFHAFFIPGDLISRLNVDFIDDKVDLTSECGDVEYRNTQAEYQHGDWCIDAREF